MTLQIIPRADWGAAVGLGHPMRLPAAGIHVHHSVTRADRPRDDMAEIEKIGKQRFGRFPYSWCIHPSGLVLVGAGNTIGAHTEGYNSTSFGVCFIGNYETDHLSHSAVVAFVELRTHLVRSGQLAFNHYVRPHRDRKATACPGRHVMGRWDALTHGTPPSPQPASELEDDSMKDVILQADHRPATWVRGEQLVRLRDGNTVGALVRAGIPTVNITTADYDNIHNDLRAREIKAE